MELFFQKSASIYLLSFRDSCRSVAHNCRASRITNDRFSSYVKNKEQRAKVADMDGSVRGDIFLRKIWIRTHYVMTMKSHNTCSRCWRRFLFCVFHICWYTFLYLHSRDTHLFLYLSFFPSNHFENNPTVTVSTFRNRTLFSRWIISLASGSRHRRRQKSWINICDSVLILCNSMQINFDPIVYIIINLNEFE